MVWACPGSPEDIRGIHGGPRGWESIAARLAGRAYSYRAGHRLRRYASRAQAVLAYNREAARHSSPPDPVFFWWP